LSKDWTPQKFDSIARTITTAIISIALVGAVIVEALTSRNHALTPLDASLIGWAGTVVGFYLGGHVAQNTAGLEETRQQIATAAGEAAAIRSEDSAIRSEESSRGHKKA
jgi:hypothetical protein